MRIDQVLEADLKWRESELASLKRLAINAQEGSVTYQSLLRALWALLYAHFEGFTKYSWDTLFDYIQSEKIPKEALSEPFAMIALEKDFKSLRVALDAASIMQFLNVSMPAAMQSEADFPEEVRLKTDSNLWPNVFERETSKLGINCEELVKHRSRIKALVARRNDIAHGKGMTIASVAEYHTYENSTLCLMHELAIKTIEIIDSKSYRKS
jgi:hypothetical protein